MIGLDKEIDYICADEVLKQLLKNFKTIRVNALSKARQTFANLFAQPAYAVA